MGDAPDDLRRCPRGRRRRVDGLAGLRPSRSGQRRDGAARSSRRPSGSATAPSRITGSLGRQTGAVALMVSDITNPFYGEIIKGAEEAVRQAGLRAAALRHLRDRPGRARGRRAHAGPRRGHRAGQLADERLRDPHDRQAEAARAAEPADHRDVRASSRTTRAAMRRAVEHLGMLGHDTITYVAGPEASWAEGMRWRALREAAHELELRVRRIDPHDDPTMRTGHARRAPDRRRRRDGRARLQRRAGDRRHQGPQAARRARCPATSASSGSTTCCSPRSWTRR